MKKVLAIMFVFLVIVFYFAFMRFQRVGVIELEGYVVSSSNLAKDLLQEDDDEEKNISLVNVTEFSSIYRQRNKLFIGENKKIAVNLEYPVYAKDGSRIWNYSSENQLITKEFEQTESYNNLFIASTNLYNGTDYEKADEENYWFMSFKESLYMNNISLEIKTNTQEFTIPVYSILSFQENKIRYYQKEEDKLIRKSITGVDDDTKIIIGDKELSYKDLLIFLGLKGELNEVERPIEGPEEPAPDDPTEEEPGNSNPPNNSDNDDNENNNNSVKTVNVTFSNLEAGIYSMSGTLTIDDPGERIVKSPTFEIKYKNQTYLRKTFSTSGKIDITGLLPDTEFELIVTYTYRNSQGRKMKRTIYEDKFRTKDISGLEDIDLEYKIDKVFSKKVMLEGFSFQNDASSDVFKGLKKIVVKFDDQEFNFSVSQINEVKAKEKIDYSTPELLDSNKIHKGIIEIYDVAENKLSVNNNSFTARTSKAMPKINLEVIKTDITKFTAKLNIDNPDDVKLNRLRFEIYNMDQILVQEGMVKDDLLIEGKNLPAGQVYRVLILGDYDLEDGNGNQLNQLLKDTKISTTPLSALGFVRLTFKEIEIKQNVARYEATINPRTTDSRLLELLYQVVIIVKEKGKDEIVNRVVVEGEKIGLLQTGNAALVEIDSLKSMTEYTVETFTIIKQGDIENELVALSNLKQFKTPKKDAEVKIINSFTTENMIDFDVKIEDKDGAIQSTRVLLEVRNDKGTLILYKELSINGDYERIQLSKLEKDIKYNFKFTAEEYNIGYNNLTFEGNKVLSEFDLETTVGLQGKIILDSLLSQITSDNIFNISNLNKWKKEGDSNLDSLTNDVANRIMKFASKNGYANYSYYMPEFKNDLLKVSFSVRHTSESNMQKVYLSYGGGSNHQNLLDGLSKDWKEFTFFVTPTNGRLGFYLEEIENNNTITEIEVRDLLVISYSQKLQDVTKRDSYYNGDSEYAFSNTIIKNGNETMPNQTGNGTVIGNYGNGFAKITNLNTNEEFLFEYKGIEQTFQVEKTGTYKIETWGAAGGDGSGKPGFHDNASSRGGRGGYSAGEIDLESGTTLYIYVGQQGTYGNNDIYSGTKLIYNGGGAGGSLNTGSGGGATDIRLRGGAWNDELSLRSRIMVAGGGGGADKWEKCLSNCSATNDGSGGPGGGITSPGSYVKGILIKDYGVSQIKAADINLGIGQNATKGVNSGGAGGGYYGGKTSNLDTGGGAGGSSYVSGHEGCISLKTFEDMKNAATSYSIYQEKEKYMGNIYVNINDNKKEISTKDFYVQISRNGSEEAIYKYDLINHKIENFLIQYEFVKNSTYELNLLVKIRDRFYSIHKINFKTDEEIRTIYTLDDFFNIHNRGTYLVATDLSLRKTWKNMGAFSGILDFQGHRFDLDYSTNNLFSTFSSSAKILNIDYHFYINNNPIWNWGLVSTNNGTISNIIITLESCNTSSKAPLLNSSLLSKTNRGIIENFVVNTKVEIPVTYNFGILTYENSGIIRNGYLFGEPIDATYDSGSTASRLVGAVAGNQIEGGIIENIFSLIDMKVITSSSTGVVNPIVGNIVGRLDKGRISNVYSYTERRTRNLKLDPNLGISSSEVSSAITENLFYINPEIFADVKSRKVSKIALRNVEFQDSLLNNSDQFIVEEFVRYGFFPQIKMNEMMPKQEYVELPIVSDEDLVDIISVEDVKTLGNEATVTLKLHNPGKEEIIGVSIQNLDADIISQSISGTTSTVEIRLYNPVKYVSKYFVNSITSVGALNIPYVRKYDPNEKILDVDLYRSVTTVEEWKEIRNLPNENYLLMNDLDFKDELDVNLNNFSGIINGNNYTIKNIESSNGAGIIVNSLTGTVKNLFVKNVKKTNSSDSTALIASMSGGTVDNVHVTDITIPASFDTGGLVGVIRAASVVKNSSVTNLKLTFKENGADYRIGGLVGAINSGLVTNSFAQGIDIDVRDFEGTVASLGGLVGISVNGTIDSCYAIGKIKTKFLGVGGIIGDNSGTIRNVYSMVDIESSQGLVGGIVGDDGTSRVSNTLAIGSILSTLGDNTINRTSGNTILNKQNYAWEEQRINGMKNSKTNGEVLLTTEELYTPFTYRNIIQLGEGFSYLDVDNKLLPKLYGKDTTELLPNQEDISLTDFVFEISKLVTQKRDKDALILLEIKNPNRYEINNIEIDGMKVAEIRRNILSDQNITTLELIIEPNKYYDSYKMEKIYYIKDGKQEEYNQSLKIDLQFYKNLRNYADWQAIDPNTQENYRLVDDIDFAGKEVKTGISFNRLEGTDDGHTLKNIQVTSPNNNNFLIKEIKMSISKVYFENVEIISNYPYDSTGNGIFGITYGNFSDMKFTNIKVLSNNKLNRSGIVSHHHAQSTRNVELTNVEVNGKQQVGGFAGYLYFYDVNSIKLSNVRVTAREQVGGFVGIKEDSSVSNTNFDIIADEVHVEAIGASYTGYAGILYGKGGASDVIITNSSVNGKHHVGGLSGEQTSGVYSNIKISNVTIKAKGNYIGGLFGRHGTILDSVLKDSVIEAGAGSSYVGGMSGFGWNHIERCLVSNVEIKGEADYVGGIVGGLRNNNYKNNTVQATTITGNNYVGGLAGAKIEDSAAYVANNLINAVITAKGESAGGLVGYYNNEKTPNNLGVMQAWNNIIMSCIVNAQYYAGGYIGSTDLALSSKDGGLPLIIIADVNTESESIQPGIVLGDGHSFETIATIGNSVAVYKDSKLNGTPVSGIPMSGIPQSYFFNASRMREKTLYTSRWFGEDIYDYSKLEEGYFPKLKYHIEDQVDVLMPTEGIQMFMARRSLMFMKNYRANFPEVNVYASDIDKINIEFSNRDENITLKINDKSYSLTERVMTFNYDYQDDIEFTLSDGINTKEYKLSKEDLRKTLLTKGNYYYYIEEDGIKTNQGNIDGHFIHLYDHYALMEDGQIIDLNNRTRIENDLDNLSKNDIPKSIFESDYDSQKIKTYYNFSLIDDEKEIDKQIFVKNSQMSFVSSTFENKKEAIIIDSFNSKDYLVLLGNDGTLYSLKNQIRHPKDFKNREIKEISSNISDNSTMIIIRYEDDTVYCFDYRTGVKIASSKSKEKVNIIDFMNDYIKTTYNDTFDMSYTNKYENAQSLIEKLEENSLEKALDKEEKTSEKEYIMSYDPLKESYEVYEIKSYIKNELVDDIINKKLSINDNIYKSNQLMDFYKTDTESKLATKKINGFYVFISLTGILIVLFLFLAGIFFKLKNKNKILNIINK